VPGFIKRYCTPNAMLTMAEYLEDYAENTTREKGYRLIQKNLQDMEQGKIRRTLEERLELVKNGARDLYF
jgi:2-iminoacetate synthase